MWEQRDLGIEDQFNKMQEVKLAKRKILYCLEFGSDGTLLSSCPGRSSSVIKTLYGLN